MLKIIGGITSIIMLIFFSVVLFGGSILHKAESSQEQAFSQPEVNAWQIWEQLGDKDYSEEARAGILGNIDQETGGTFEADIDENSGNGYGLIQWTPKKILLEQINRAGIKGGPELLKTQVEVIDWELSGEGRGYIPTKSYPYSGEEFKKLKNVKIAVRAYEKNRERPRDDHPERQALAQKWFDRFSGKDSSSVSSSNIVAFALDELGNRGGEKFWSWYGYSQRVEWCATFVSWCGNQSGSEFEKFAYCPTGINLFRSKGKWLTAGQRPESGYVIFFDWESDGISDHVGLVINYENGVVHTVEGNSNDEVKLQQYSVKSAVISGYGIP